MVWMFLNCVRLAFLKMLNSHSVFALIFFITRKFRSDL